jgi:hypothetical protein
MPQMSNQSLFHIQPNMIFPSTKMEAVNKLITEGNLTRLINTLIDTDKYVIPPEGTDFSVTKNIDGHTLISLPADTANTHLEFAIHGYYFDLGAISNAISTIIAQQPSSSTYKVVAQILVDTTVPNYLELFGEEDSTQTTTISGSFMLGTATLDEAYRDKAISEITTTIDGQSYVLSYRKSDWKLTATDLQEGTTFTSYTIKYVVYSNFINLYILNLDDDYPVPSPAGVDSFDVYNLDLLYYTGGNYYFPLSSFVKFDAQSIGHIDGGEIK